MQVQRRSHSKMWRQLGLFSLENLRLWGYLIAVFQYLKWAYRQERNWHSTRSDSDRTRGNNFKQKEDRLIYMLGLLFFFFFFKLLRGWLGTPEKPWKFQPWRYSRPVWMGPWTVWPSAQQPHPKQRGWNYLFKSLPTHAILWFCVN